MAQHIDVAFCMKLRHCDTVHSCERARPQIGWTWPEFWGCHTFANIAGNPKISTTIKGNHKRLWPRCWQYLQCQTLQWHWRLNIPYAFVEAVECDEKGITITGRKCTWTRKTKRNTSLATGRMRLCVICSQDIASDVACSASISHAAEQPLGVIQEGGVPFELRTTSHWPDVKLPQVVPKQMPPGYCHVCWSVVRFGLGLKNIVIFGTWLQKPPASSWSSWFLEKLALVSPHSCEWRLQVQNGTTCDVFPLYMYICIYNSFHHLPPTKGFLLKVSENQPNNTSNIKVKSAFGETEGKGGTDGWRRLPRMAPDEVHSQLVEQPPSDLTRTLPKQIPKQSKTWLYIVACKNRKLFLIWIGQTVKDHSFRKDIVRQIQLHINSIQQ